VGRVAEEYCDLCDLPLRTCVHGMPKPPPPPAAAPRAPRTRTATPRASAARTTAAPTRAPSRVTDQSAFRPHIVRILKAEGSLETEDMLLELEMAMEDELRERDRQPTPTGEVRWHQSARMERKAMIDAGLMAGGKPGIWELTDAGRAIAY
jgi:hypothetical protein